MSSASQLLASRRADRILAIHDPSDAPATRAPACADLIERVSKIAVTAGHGEGSAGKEHPGSSDQPVLDSPRDAGFAAADVAHCRKSAVQCVAQHFCRVARDIGQGLGLKIRDLDTRSQNMTVRIDQSRHQCLSADIDDIAVDGGAAIPLHRYDAVCFDDDHRIVEVVALDTVEDLAVHKCGSMHDSLHLRALAAYLAANPRISQHNIRTNGVIFRQQGSCRHGSCDDAVSKSLLCNYLVV